MTLWKEKMFGVIIIKPIFIQIFRLKWFKTVKIKKLKNICTHFYLKIFVS